MDGLAVSLRTGKGLRNRGRQNGQRAPKQRPPLTRTLKNQRHGARLCKSVAQNHHHGSCIRQHVTKIAGKRHHDNHRAKQHIEAAACLNNNLDKDGVFDDPAVGPFSREVYNAISNRLGEKTYHIPEDSVQTIFNDMKLYPSEAQVSKMLQCVKRFSRNGATPDYLTFGEFCYLAREMKNQSPIQHRKQSLHKANNKCTNNCEVFLGGSCNPTTWRADTAIPELQKHGISFYNPQVTMWAPELVAQEHDAKQAASVLLFVIDSQTRSTVGMIEVAYLVASGRCVVVVAQPYIKGQSIMGEVISETEYKDLKHVQNCLLSLVKSRGVKIHKNLQAALQCTASIVRNSSTPVEDQLLNKLRKLRDVYDFYEGKMSYSDLLEAYNKLTNKSPNINGIMTAGRRLGAGMPPINGAAVPIAFERFCTLMAEFSTDDCDMCTNDEWASQTFQRRTTVRHQTSCDLSNSRVQCLIESHVDEPKSQTLYDVYLGGSLTTGTKWRQEVAIPLLKKHSITYYNPAIREEDANNRAINGFNGDTTTTSTAATTNGYGSSSEEDDASFGSDSTVLEWKKTMDESRVLLFYITNDTRSMGSMVMAAHYMGLKRKVVLCIQHLASDNCVIDNETLTKNAIKDYNRARVYLADLAKRKQIPVFDNITEAVQCAMERLNAR